MLRTALDNPPLIDHQNLIGVPDRFEPVCNHNYGFLARQLADCLHQLLLVFRVHIRGRLVQDDHGRIFHDGAGNGKPLALAAGKYAAAFSEHGIIPLRQLCDKLVAAGFLCRFYLNKRHTKTQAPEQPVWTAPASYLRLILPLRLVVFPLTLP